MSQRAQTFGSWASRARAALVVAIISLVIGGWVFIWNGDGGGPFPVVLVERVPASLPYLLTIAALGAHLLRPHSSRTSWFVLGATSAAALATVQVRRSVLRDANSINGDRTGDGGVVGVENALTRAVSGQLTEVDSTFFSLSWALATGCLLAATIASGITLSDERKRSMAALQE